MAELNSLVLVHGSMHGPWCFDLLLPHLHGFASIRNVDVLENCTCLADCVRVVRREVEQEARKGYRVVLLGHSFAGMIISQVAEEIPALIAHLIYVAAYLPADNESRTDIQTRFNVRLPFDHRGNTVIASREAAQAYLYNESPKEIVDWAISQLRPQDVTQLREKVRLTEANFGSVPKSFVLCLKDRTIPSDCQKWMVSRRKPFKDITQVLELEGADHFPQLCMPERVAHFISSTSITTTSLQPRL